MSFAMETVVVGLVPLAVAFTWMVLGKDLRARRIMKLLTTILAVASALLVPSFVWPMAYCDPAFIFGYNNCSILTDNIAGFGKMAAILGWMVAMAVTAIAGVVCAVFEVKGIVRSKRLTEEAQAKYSASTLP